MSANHLGEQQCRHEARLDWLRSLKPGDEVALTCDGADRLKTTDRVKVERVRLTGFGTSGRDVFLEGHPRRPLRDGVWKRKGKDWLWLRIDPIGGPDDVRR